MVETVPCTQTDHERGIKTGGTKDVDDAPVTSRSHTHPSQSQTDHLLTSSMSLGITVPHAT
jgi:hypothetical protein